MWQPYHEQWEWGLHGIGAEFPRGPGITDLKPAQSCYSAVIHGDLRRFHACRDVPLAFAAEPALIFPLSLSPSANKSSSLFADPLWWLSPHCSRGDRLLAELLNALDATTLQLHLAYTGDSAIITIFLANWWNASCLCNVATERDLA